MAPSQRVVAAARSLRTYFEGRTAELASDWMRGAV